MIDFLAMHDSLKCKMLPLFEVLDEATKIF